MHLQQSLYYLSVFALAAPLLSTASEGDQKRDKYLEVSIIQLISNPDMYDGKAVIVSGFLYIGFENAGLYLSKDDARYGVITNSLAIGQPVQEDFVFPNNFYVEMIGVFHHAPSGHMGLWSGEITKITSVRRLEARTIVE